MAATSASTGPSDGALDLPLGAADQSCKECRRRKAKCDKAMPTCSLCAKYRRHCLYEKHSRTPLTRRHLTEVEERLERAEALIRRMRRTGAAGNANPDKPTPSRRIRSDEEFDFCELDKPLADNALANVQLTPSGTQRPASSSQSATSGPQDANLAQTTTTTTTTTSPASHRRASRKSHVSQFRAVPGNVEENPSRPSNSLLETPPKDDFEWDEVDVTTEHSPFSDMMVEGEEEDQIKDGMASLAVSEKEGGYLGVASGAAMLRLLEPNARPATPRSNSHQYRRLPSIMSQPDPNRHIVDHMIDAYFATYHPSYPIIHEPTFRAQYSEVIPQPNGRSWQVLAYVVAALGVYSSGQTAEDLGLQLSSHAKSMLSFDFLELGNLTLVQALTLMSNYQQKRNKPNSGYNYLGLAVSMATGLGLHKEFPGWNISPLKMEIRRRVWWALCVFHVGATITFSRPTIWPYEGVEVGYPMNVTDRDLTANSSEYPNESLEITNYSAVSTQARFHVATQEIYSRVISKPFPAAEELLRLDDELIGSWRANLPPYFNETCQVPPKYQVAQYIMQWRFRNFRIIMYRPFVIRAALQGRHGRSDDSAANREAYERCLDDAQFTIRSIGEYGSKHEHNRLGSWYALYFLFQAAMIPCICLRNAPGAAAAGAWSELLNMTLQTIRALGPTNSSAKRCYQVIVDLCGQYLNGGQPGPTVPAPSENLNSLPPEAPGNAELNHTTLGVTDTTLDQPSPGRMELGPTDESPQTQINQVYPMMWPNITAMEAEEVMGDDAWLEFLGGGGDDIPQQPWEAG